MTPRKDARAIITPESFAVAPQLLGLPLARPMRRALAVLLDLIPVAILANVGVGTFLAFFSAFLVWRALSFAGKNKAARPAWKILRAGASLAALIAVLQLAGAVDRDNGDRSAESPSADSIRSLVQNAQQLVLRELNIVPEGSESAANATGELAKDSAVLLYAAALQRADSAALDSLRPGASRAIAGARISQLEEGSRRLAERTVELEQDIDELERQAERSERGGFVAWVSAIADNLGIGFGWSAIYFTTFLVLGKGQTPGKRATGIRVIRLDAKPITWWIAFERFGGYFASLSTGLLGFLQVFWDRNRQALHDKAVETVVIRVLPGSTIPSTLAAPHALH